NGINIVQVNPATGGGIAGPFTLSTPPPDQMDDKAIMTADPLSNDLYLVWTRLVSPLSVVLLRRAHHPEVTWSEDPVPVSLPDEGFVWPASVAVAPNGDVYVAYHSQVGFTLPGRDLAPNPDGHTGATFVARFKSDLSPVGKSLAFLPGESDITF